MSSNLRSSLSSCVRSLLLCMALLVPHHALAQQWQLVDGAAKDVGIGADGSVWVIGTDARPGGYGIYRREAGGWKNVAGGAVRVAVDAQGNAWVANDGGSLYRYDGAKANWVLLPGVTAKDIGVGADGTAWVIGTAAEAGGFAIFRSTDQGATWRKVPGSALRVAVDPQGNAWVVNNSGQIWQFNGSAFVNVPGQAKDVGVGSDGLVWVTGLDDAIYRREGASGWVRKTGAAVQVAAGPGGSVWVVNSGSQIYSAQLPAPAAGTVVVNVNQNLNISAPTTVIPAPNVNVSPPTTPIQIQGIGSIDVTPPPAPTPAAQPQSPAIKITGLGYAVGPVGASAATCGVKGTGLCDFQPAELVRNASISCPTGSFPDLGKGSCWSCPSGYQRSAAPVDGDRACQQADSAQKGGFEKATFRAYLCPEGSFHDPIRGGECYSCPSGYRRSAAHIDAPNACFKPATENLTSATRKRNGLAWDCKSGEFWDGWDGGACWTCPSGYNRTGNHINSGKACSQAVAEKQATAKLEKRASCGPGEFFDMKIPGTQNFARGGACYTCPKATDRTIFAVDSDKACERAPGLRFSVATRTMALTCEEDEIFDPINSNESAVRTRLNERNARFPQSPLKSAGSGGTCWTCPAGTKRSMFPVYGTQACNPPNIQWQPARYNQPGLFGLSGAEAVALKLVAERTAINDVIASIQASAPAGSLPANYARTVWDEIATRPQDSAELQTAVFARVVAAAVDPGKATEDERRLLKDVIDRIQQFRVFMAQDALDAYYAWKNNQVYREDQFKRSQLQVMFDTGTVPPDFEEITAETILGSLVASRASATAISLTMESSKLFEKLFPYAGRESFKAAKTAQTATRAGEKMARASVKIAKAGAETGKAAGQAAGAAASGLTSAIASLGPQIIVAIGIEILAVAIEQQIDIANAEPKLKAGLATARSDSERVDFKRLAATTAGTQQATGYWAQLMAGPAPKADGTLPPAPAPVQLQSFAQLAQAAQATIR